MRVGVAKETHRGEKRVAATPDTVRRLVKQGFEVMVEHGAGRPARFPDAAYADAGAELVETDALYERSELLMKVREPRAGEVGKLNEGTVLICSYSGDETSALVEKLTKRKVTLMALEAVPRITRAQSMDVRSSMANIAGYRAVVEAASHFGRFFGGQMTAAGSTPPAKVLVIGAGVAGLAAIAAARSLGAVVRAFDTRAATREQVESLGGEFLEVEMEESGEGKGGYAKVMSQAFIDAEMALFLKQAADIDVVITTALIPNRPAPKQWLAEHVEAMGPGSVVVDLAASQGGNCELTVPGKVVEEHGVTLIGFNDLTSRMPSHASQYFGRNIVALLGEMGGGKAFTVDLDNEIVRAITVTRDGEVRWPAPPVEPSPPSTPPEASEPAAAVAAAKTTPQAKAPAVEEEGPNLVYGLALFVSAFVVMLLARNAPADFLQHLTVFVLACFVGWQVVWNVTPALHTPLMSVTNAVSGIILVGGMLQVASVSQTASLMAVLAILFASVNVFGGFGVTHRMLAMFRK